ncbi:uncharacterized protein LOC120680101 [Panicum virgatum]|uniref:Uncharacterized protein n=1 Tax=Panicum virgatum TaxID=38727 RepID=A0A8T0QSH7_PANVG|nr:uncharacterized protein LOC120680101 [Panicum virgatum]KAG2576003.1 hypothetical protein PVAP13_6NG000701 [Panicum virgatum]
MATNTVWVGIFDDFLKDGFTALKWAKKEFVTKSPQLKLHVILIKKADVAQAPVIRQPLTGVSIARLSNWQEIVDMFFPRFLPGGQQARQRFDVLFGDFKKNIAGEMYEGTSIQHTLKFAMQQIKDLDTLIVGCAAGAITTERSKLPTELELSAGCKQIVLVEKIVSPPPPPRTAHQTAPPAGRESAAPSDPSTAVISFMVVCICASMTGTRPDTKCTVKLFQADDLE